MMEPRRWPGDRPGDSSTEPGLCPQDQLLPSAPPRALLLQGGAAKVGCEWGVTITVISKGAGHALENTSFLNIYIYIFY